MKHIILDGKNVTISDINNLARSNSLAAIDVNAREKIKKSRELLEDVVAKEPIYGITTGYGEMVYLLVERSKEQELQTNLVRSHAACVGNNFSREVAKAMVAVRLNTFCRGYSAVREALVDRLLLMLNNNIIPAIPEIGSLGASGDLGQLAHLALTVMGEGYALDKKGECVPSIEVFRENKLETFDLKYKEGLALINGTSAMTGLGSCVAFDAEVQLKQAEIISALVLENQRASSGAFQLEGHQLGRPHQGQIDCASNMLQLFKGSELIVSHQQLKSELQLQAQNSTPNNHVFLQKAYTLRCVPQILGAIRDTLHYVKNTLTIEINSSNDNPLFFEGKDIFHGGNFHGQPIAFVMDFLSIALTQLGVVAERRINRLLNKNLSNGLPEFLAKKTPGLHCGFEGAQYPATAMVAENRTICTPASIQSIPSNEDNQDVVSMGLLAARKCERILKNNNYILAIELLCVAQAVDIASHYKKLSVAGKAVYDLVRMHVPTLDEDRYMTNDINKIANLINQGVVLSRVADLGISLV